MILGSSKPDWTLNTTLGDTYLVTQFTTPTGTLLKRISVFQLSSWVLHKGVVTRPPKKSLKERLMAAIFLRTCEASSQPEIKCTFTILKEKDWLRRDEFSVVSRRLQSTKRQQETLTNEQYDWQMGEKHLRRTTNRWSYKLYIN